MARRSIWIGLGLVIAALGGMVSTIPSQAASQSQSSQTLTPVLPTPTVTPGAGVSQIGSTDGIVLMGIVIVMIVVLPVLLQRRTWGR